MRQLPVADEAAFTLLEQEVTMFCETLEPLNAVPTVEEWLEHTPYPAHRRLELLRAHDELAGGAPNRAQRRKVKSFVKSESYLTVKHARLINSRSDACKVYMGPAVHAMESVIFSMPWFAKSYKTQEALVSHIANAPKKLYWYATDYTAFESHMIPSVIRSVEGRVYKRMLSHVNPGLARFMVKTLSGMNVCSTRSGVRYKVEGRRMSGDMQTSLGNSVTNYCLAKMVCRAAGETNPFIIVEGDDALVGSDFPLDETLWQKAGFSIKVECVEGPNSAGFCGKVFGESCQTIRDPVRFLQTFGWSDAAVGAGPKYSAQLLAAKALSAAFENPHCPIIRAVADRALLESVGVRPKWIYDGYHSEPGHIPNFDPTPSTRALFEKLYGVSPDAQIEIEKAVRGGDLSVLSHLVPVSADQLFYDAYIT